MCNYNNDGQDELYEFKCTMRKCYDELVSKEKSLSSEVRPGDRCMSLPVSCSNPTEASNYRCFSDNFALTQRCLVSTLCRADISAGANGKRQTANANRIPSLKIGRNGTLRVVL